MILQELNNNILFVIISLLSDSGPEDILGFSLSCRLFYTLSWPYIARHISFGNPSPRYDLFCRTLAENPMYAQQIHFCFEIGIFYQVVRNRLDNSGRNQFESEDLLKSSYQWILELASQKDSCLPELRTVKLYEEIEKRSIYKWRSDLRPVRRCGYGGEPVRLFIVEEWDPPLSVDYAFDDADIDLGVFVRAPYSEDEAI
ncbi:hypothetical protein IFR05_003068 [Cadophora sp. M221]|nr:hypothetical protein IFR05_003068 [Cadophora sp. M221]